MPPGKAACRSVVQNAIIRQTQLVWITDNVLADAFHRFLNVSNAGRKRFGSNVPGPLEARRRASKRHMMGLAAAGPAISPDWGALFGADKPGDQAWTWEAPRRAGQPRRVGRPRASALPQWFSDFDQAHKKQGRATDPLKAYGTRLSNVRNTIELENLWSELGVEPRHAVLPSQLANAHFMENLNTKDMDQSPFLAFLRNPRLNIPEARNIQVLVEYATKNGLPKGFLGPLKNTIEDSLRLGTMMASELDVIVDRMPELCAKACKDRGSADRWEFNVYWAIWRGLASCKVLPVDKVGNTVIRKMVERISVLQQTPAVFRCEEPDKPGAPLLRLEIYSHLWPIESQAKPGDYAAHFVSWTRKLAKLGVKGSDRAPDGLGWNTLKSLLNSMHVREAESAMTVATSALLFSDQGATLDEDLRLWLTCISQTRHLDATPEEQRDTRVQIPSLADILDLVLARNPSLANHLDPLLASEYFQISSADKFVQIWMRHWVPQYMVEDGMARRWNKRRREKVMLNYKKRPSWLKSEPYHPFYAAIWVLRAKRLPCRTAQSKAMELVFAMYGSEAVVELYEMFENVNLYCRDPRPLAAVINTTCATNPILALKYYKIFGRVPLRLCPILPITLIEHGSLPRDEFFAMLSRRYRDHVPPTTSSTPPSRADLIHAVAYAYANQTSRPPRQRYRNVHACYLYLRDHFLPLTPLLSKALVHAGIIAPLENNEWVSTTKLRFILDIVASLESPDVAESLDRLVWEWRGKVIKEAQQRWDAAGLYRTRGPSTVTEARNAGLFDEMPPLPQRAAAGLFNPEPDGEEEEPLPPPPLALRGRRYRKLVMVGGGWRAPKCAWRARYGGIGGRRKVWARLPRRLGGQDGDRRPHSPFTPRR